MQVAVKLLADTEMLRAASEAEYEQQLLAFSEEGKTLAALHHANIVRYFGTSTDLESRLLLVMEFCDRGSLRDVLDSPHRFAWPELWQLAFDCSKVRGRTRWGGN